MNIRVLSQVSPMAGAVVVYVLACFHFWQADAACNVQAKKRKQLAAAERGSAKGKAKPTRSADEDVPRKAQRSSKGGPIFDDDSDGMCRCCGDVHGNGGMNGVKPWNERGEAVS